MSQVGQILLKGRVNPLSGGLPGVNVFLSDKQGNLKLPTKGTATDVNGNFQLLATTLDQYITFSFIGYGKKTFPINSFQDKQKVNVELQEQSNELNNFEVVAKKNEPYNWKIISAIIIVVVLIVALIIFNYKTKKQ